MSVGKCPHVNNNNKGNEQASTWFQLINERKGQKKKKTKRQTCGFLIALWNLQLPIPLLG